MSAPRIGFLIGGVQKSGTTALARHLADHPELALPKNKEAHVFDAPGFDDRWSTAEIDARYAPHFPACATGKVVHGDATPMYLFHPLLVQRIARYNPAMRWIVMLRHPVERAYSHYRMERRRGEERWPMWPALLLERCRLRGKWDDLGPGSAIRRFSYRARGDYATQLDTLYRHFPSTQVLLVRDTWLASDPAATLARIQTFLGVKVMEPSGEFTRVFEGGYEPLQRGSLRWRLLCALMRRELVTARRRYGIDWTGGEPPSP